MMKSIDFRGQELCEKLYQYILIGSAVVGVVYGFSTQQFSKALIIYACGFVLSLLLTIPGWPLYKRHPVQWRPKIAVAEVNASETGAASTSEGTTTAAAPPTTSRFM